MKKSFLFIILLFILGINLSACAESPGIEQSSLPEDFYVQKAKESGEFISLVKEERFEIPSQDEHPSGTYLLLFRKVENYYILLFYKQDNLVCRWDKFTTHPYFFKDKELPLYIIENNCTGMGEDEVIWYLEEEKAFLNGVQIDIWTLDGSQYTKN